MTKKKRKPLTKARLHKEASRHHVGRVKPSQVIPDHRDKVKYPRKTEEDQE